MFRKYYKLEFNYLQTSPFARRSTTD